MELLREGTKRHARRDICIMRTAVLAGHMLLSKGNL